MKLDYPVYLDKILGGWIGKSAGGAVGARFEGFKGWIELDRDHLFPEAMPPNDDLDLQVLWLSVLERRGLDTTADDLARAWLDGAWYPFNEYGNFRRNYRLGIKPPRSGHFHNEFFDTGMGSPIRSEIWGYTFPGAPDLAARYAWMDGTLDHSAQSAGAEQMFAAMASLAFFIGDVRRLIELTLHYLPSDTPIARLSHAAIEAHADGLTLREARDRLLALDGHPEACDARLNVPFTLLGMLYGEHDVEETLLGALRCGYDTDCTCATATALVGQIAGASRLPANIRGPIGDGLVMGIQYRRPEMTLSALARDTARIGMLFAESYPTGVEIANAPDLASLPLRDPPRPHLRVDYLGAPLATPGSQVAVQISLTGDLPQEAELSVEAPAEWRVVPHTDPINHTAPVAQFCLQAREAAPVWSQRNLFRACLRHHGEAIAQEAFGVEGAAPWAFLGVYFDPYPPAGVPAEVLTTGEMRKRAGELGRRAFQHHFARLDAPYIADETAPDIPGLYRHWTRILDRPAVLYAKADRITPTDLIGLQGAYVMYLAQTLISPDDRQVNVVIGNNDGYRLYVNGERVAEVDEQVWWTPYNNVHPARLRKGSNLLLLKLLKRGETLEFTIGVRAWQAGRHHNTLDWCTDLQYGNPLSW